MLDMSHHYTIFFTPSFQSPCTSLAVGSLWNTVEIKFLKMRLLWIFK